MYDEDRYQQPVLQPVNVGGWEDGLYITRDGRHLYSTYLPLDAFSWITDLLADPVCFDFDPYYRPPLLDIDTVTNFFGCEKFMQSDIVIAERNAADEFTVWQSSNLRSAATFEGGACGVLSDSENFDVFVFTKDAGTAALTDIMFMKNVPADPPQTTAVAILSSEGQEDNPHIERLDENTLLLFFDRDRYIYYSISDDNGDTWQEPVLITQVLNDQAPYDVQPHLWYDDENWWVYFCADDAEGVRCIYRAKQILDNNWDSWGDKELVIAPGTITDGSGSIFGIGEPSLTQWGDLSFVVIYGNLASADTNDVFDCDPWIMYKKDSPLAVSDVSRQNGIKIYPVPASNYLHLHTEDKMEHAEISVISAEGKLVMSRQNITGQEALLSLEDLHNGIYFLRIKDQERLSAIKFVVGR